MWEEPNCCLIPDFTFLSSKLVQTSNSVNHCNQFNILNWNLWKTVYHLLMRQQNAKRWRKKKCSDEKSERHKKIITVIRIQTHCVTKMEFLRSSYDKNSLWIYPVWQGVNFINILHTHFLYESASRSFSLVTFWL